MSARVVLDASAALAWASPDEAPSKSLSDAIEAGGLVVPPLWPYEIHNVLTMIHRKGRWDRETTDIVRDALLALDVAIEEGPHAHVATQVAQLAVKHTLTVYDAAYLELAQRHRLPLATLDHALRQAARRLKVALI